MNIDDYSRAVSKLHRKGIADLINRLTAGITTNAPAVNQRPLAVPDH